MNIARAASKTPTVEHFIMSTLPPASQVSGGKLKVPHMDYKHAAYEWLKANLPDLAKKTTRLWLGWYPSNLAYFPLMKFIPVVSGLVRSHCDIATDTDYSTTRVPTSLCSPANPMRCCLWLVT
jgi:hypothetical protein